MREAAQALRSGVLGGAAVVARGLVVVCKYRFTKRHRGRPGRRQGSKIDRSIQEGALEPKQRFIFHETLERTRLSSPLSGR